MRRYMVIERFRDGCWDAVYERFESSGLGVYNVMKLWANDPGFLTGFESMINALYADDTLEARYREFAWLRTSQINSCHY